MKSYYTLGELSEWVYERLRERMAQEMDAEIDRRLALLFGDAETGTATTVGDGDAGKHPGADRAVLEADGEGVVG